MDRAMSLSRSARLDTAFSSLEISSPRVSTSVSLASVALMSKYFIRYLSGSALAFRTTCSEQLCTFGAA